MVPAYRDALSSSSSAAGTIKQRIVWESDVIPKKRPLLIFSKGLSSGAFHCDSSYSVVPIAYVLTRFKFWVSKMILNIYMACIFLQASYIMVPFAIGRGVAAVRDSGVMSANSTRVESTTLVPNILF